MATCKSIIQALLTVFFRRLVAAHNGLSLNSVKASLLISAGRSKRQFLKIESHNKSQTRRLRTIWYSCSYMQHFRCAATQFLDMDISVSKGYKMLGNSWKAITSPDNLSTLPSFYRQISQQYPFFQPSNSYPFLNL